jgi:acetyl esterase/lipase
VDEGLIKSPGNNTSSGPRGGVNSPSMLPATQPYHHHLTKPRALEPKSAPSAPKSRSGGGGSIVTTTATARAKMMNSLRLDAPPPLDPDWLAHEATMELPTPPVAPEVRQPIYAAECRALHARMMGPGARDAALALGVRREHLTMPSELDGFPVPVIRYSLDGRTPSHPLSDGKEGRTEDGAGDNASPDEAAATPVVAVYYHGGGLLVGEADSEELSIRRLLHESRCTRLRAVYSVGYRLMPQHPASTCVADALSALRGVRALHPRRTAIIIIGSSSGGELAALVSQAAPELVSGVALRCPVTSDAFAGPVFVPQRLRTLHTSAWHAGFRTRLIGVMRRAVPRDGLPKMPLEADEATLKRLPRHWVQVCTNDTLYSDGVCYAAAVAEAAGAAAVRVDVVAGWPHTFWLVAPMLERALEADRAFVKGFDWLAHGDE